MIDTFNDIRDIDTETSHGKLLLMALAILTSLDINDIKNKKWGGLISPDKALEQLVDITNQVYYEEEWKSEKIKKERDRKINELLNK